MVQVNLTASTGTSYRRPIREPGAEAGEWRDHPPQGRRPTSLSAPTITTSKSRSNGQQAVYIGIQVRSRRQPARCHRAACARSCPTILAQLPQGLNGAVVYDSTAFVSSSISEVEHTLIEALLIVTVVVFIFIGSPRSVLIPVIAIPLFVDRGPSP